MKRAIITALTAWILAGPVQAKAGSIVCDPTCRDPTEASANSASSAASLSSSKATGAIAGTQVNAPISSSSTSQGGSADVTVINTTSNRVSNRSSNRNYSGSSGGGYRGYSHGSGAVASTANTATTPADPPGPPLGSIQNPLSEQIGGTQTLRNVPEIIAPNISGGNPCLVGVSGGGAGPGIGITLGFGYSDKGCERRNDAAVLNNIGEKAAAIQLMCQDPHVKEAMAAAGQPCGAPAVAVAMHNPPAVDPAIVRRQQEVPAYPEVAAYPPIPQPKAIPDWCYTASGAELRAHPQCQQPH